MWYIYLVKCADDSLYCGITKNVENRIKIHNNGTGSKYTRSRLPVVFAYNEECCTKSQALQREYAIKQLTREEKLKLIEIGLTKKI